MFSTPLTSRKACWLSKIGISRRSAKKSSTSESGTPSKDLSSVIDLLSVCTSWACLDDGEDGCLAAVFCFRNACSSSAATKIGMAKSSVTAATRDMDLSVKEGKGDVGG